MRKWGIYAAPCLAMLSFSTFANDQSTLSLPANLSKSGLFIKFGGNTDQIKFDQYLNPLAFSSSFNGTNLLSYGNFGHSVNPYHSLQSTVSPDTQMGYFKHFKDSDKLWGVKFLYNYLGIADRENDSQNVVYAKSNDEPSAAGSGSVNKSPQTSVNHELALLAFIGQSFMNSHLYLGAGPSLLGMHSSLSDGSNYRQRSAFMRGAESLPNSKWLWGGAAQMGVTYYFNPTWFFDLSYTYAISGLSSNEASLPLSSSKDTYSDSNSASTNAQRLSAQSLNVSVKKVFSLF